MSTTKKTGRPKVEIDYELVKKYAMAMCRQEDIAIALGVSLSRCQHDPLFQQACIDGQAEGRNCIYTKQFELARNGNGRMLEWLGKQYLKQADKVESKNDDRVTIVIQGDDKDL